MKNDLIREARKEVADILGVEHNKEGTEYYGIRDDSVAWMCVFAKHETCAAMDCVCICHGPKNPLISSY